MRSILKDITKTVKVIASGSGLGECIGEHYKFLALFNLTYIHALIWYIYICQKFGKWFPYVSKSPSDGLEVRKQYEAL